MKDIILKSLREATGEEEINLEIPENKSFGDYSSNIALKMEKNPRQEAEKIIAKLKKDKEVMKLVEKIELAGPGFINFWIKKEKLVEELKKINQKKEDYGSSDEGKGKTMVIDYSSPNIAKRFGIGHLRSTVIGQALYNLYKTQGYKVIGDNHLGDWGTQFGVLLYQITSKGLNPDKLTIEELEKLYVDFHQEEKKDPSLHKKAKEWFKRLEEGNKEAREIWKKLVDISLTEFDRIYQMLGIKLDYAYGESFYEEYMPQVIRELREKKISKKSEGAEIIEFKDMPPAMIIKSDGTTTYFTRDLATIKFRIGSWNPDLFIYEVGNDQTLHFRQVFAAAKLLSWSEGKRFVHVNHGLIRFEHGKMSTRRGQTVKLEEILNEAIERAKKLGSENEETAKKVGIGAVVYFDLSHHPTTDIIFNWERMFVLEGNSGPYLQYTIARTNSVLEKVKEKENNKTNQLNSEEESVLRTLIHYPEVIKQAAENFSPNLLANYLFDLAQKYNNFYNNHRILESDNVEFRINLTSATGQILKNGLKILNIPAPEKM
jgi:arginyl-tRNA synthetase